MSKKLIIGTIVFVFVLPVMFIRPFENTSIMGYLMRCCMPLMIAIVFLVNYLWLIPHYEFSNNGRRRPTLQNFALVLFFCVVSAVAHTVEFNNFVKENNNGKHAEFVAGVEAPRQERRDMGGEPPFMGPPQDEPHRENHREKQHQLDARFYLLCFSRDVLNFVLAILVAYGISFSSHLTRLKREQQEAEMAQRDAELRNMRNQISPHFLLNTLNNIYALSAISVERTQSAVMQLSKMLRHMLYDNQEDEVSLVSEAEFIGSYVDLMRLRLAGNISVHTDIKVSADSTMRVSPLLFISLVENAFKHGVSPSEPCSISISLRENAADEMIECIIVNSNHPKQATDRSGHGIGMTLVQKRLDLLYPSRYKWEKGVMDDGLYHSEITLYGKPNSTKNNKTSIQ